MAMAKPSTLIHVIDDVTEHPRMPPSGVPLTLQLFHKRSMQQESSAEPEHAPQIDFAPDHAGNRRIPGRILPALPSSRM